MNKYAILFCVVALAAVALAADEQEVQGPSANEYDVYNSNGDSNLEESVRPKRFLLLKKKLLIGKALALKKKKLVLGGAAALGGGVLLGKKLAQPSTVTYKYVEAPVHYVSSYDHGHYYDDHAHIYSHDHIYPSYYSSHHDW